MVKKNSLSKWETRPKIVFSEDGEVGEWDYDEKP